MRPLQRLNFVLRQEAPRFDDEGDVNFAEVDYHDAGPGSNVTDLRTDPTTTAKSSHPLAERRGAGAKRKWLVTGEPRQEPREQSRESRDAEIAEQMICLVRDLNATMDAALKQGLVVEPVLSQVNNRYAGIDEAERYVLSLKLYRKLC